MAKNISELEQRLRRALAGTHDRAPRPLSDIELPLRIDRLLTPAILRTLRPAAVLAPVIKRGRDLTMLFTVRSEELRAHKGQISFPGGRRDEGDASFAANALREAQEEVGINPGDVEVIGYLDDYPTISRFLVTPVVGIVTEAPAWVPEAREVAEVFEAPLEFVTDLANFERKAFSRNGLNVPFYEMNFGRFRIWGATAGMLFNLATKVAAA
ncbi:MAG TPA: CoA pyrophosphatase [Solimonas sp.]|nr:CoA pyrophosphatase [Solimonas sp.]